MDPMFASRAPRYLLRNGLDYLAFREYARALSFFRAVEVRQAELTDADRDTLKKGIARAQQGIREAVNAPRVAGQKARSNVPPGSFALARPASPDAVQLTAAELPASPPAAPAPRAVARPMPAMDPTPMPAMDPTPTPAGSPALGAQLPTLPEDLPAAPAASLEPPAMAPKPDAPALPPPLPDLLPEAPATGPAPATANAPELPPIEATAPPAIPDPGPAPAPADAPETAPAPIGLDPLPGPEPAPTSPAPVVDASALPVQATSPVELPPAGPGSPAPASLPDLPAEGPSPVELPTTPPALPEPAPGPPDAAPPRLADASTRPDVAAPAPIDPAPATAPSPEPPPAAEANALPPLPAESGPAPSASRAVAIPDSMLSPKLREEVERIAQRGPGDPRPGVDPGMATDPNAPSAPSQGSTRLELQRAPSPTEARRMSGIPVPEDFVPLGDRDWKPNRKYWNAAGTCHMPLYFQDPVLERYGQGVEQALGPIGRYFSYPLDDPRQSNQRNQILQPFWSIGKFCFQVGTLPYKVLMDPPWEAEYDLGYYRPGDRIPPDTIMITPTGVGPPLRGSRY